jgi:hypothetical protein
VHRALRSREYSDQKDRPVFGSLLLSVALRALRWSTAACLQFGFTAA